MINIYIHIFIIILMININIYLPNGLNIPPAVIKPSVKSPNTWTWKPCFPGVRPLIVPSILVGASSWALFKNRNYYYYYYYY